MEEEICWKASLSVSYIYILYTHNIGLIVSFYIRNCLVFDFKIPLPSVQLV